MKFSQPLQATLAQAPKPLDTRPADTMCREECGRTVSPVKTRHGWYDRSICKRCKVLIDLRASLLDDANDRLDRMMSGFDAYRGMSLTRARIQAGLFAAERELVRALPEPTLLLTPGRSAAHRALCDWTPGSSLVLAGPTGSGKTALMLAAVQDYARTFTEGGRRTLPVQFWTSHALMGAYFRAETERRGDEFIERLLTDAGLWVDDLGLEQTSGYRTELWSNAVNDLANRASMGQGCLILSTNLSRETIGERYGSGDRLGSRLWGLTGEGERWVTVAGEDFRG